MLLTVDLGNTSIKIGLYEDYNELFFGVYDNHQNDYKSLIMSSLYKKGLREEVITDAIISSVVPELYDKVYRAVRFFVPEDRIIDINPHDNYGISLDVPDPDGVGDDLIVMNAYAYHLFKREILVVSMGTSTVINHIDANGSFRHCVIAPGLHKVAQALWGNAAQLPSFDLKKPKSFLANTTVDAMNVGIYNGYIGMVKYLIDGVKSELDSEPFIVACGGLGKKIVPYLNVFNYYDPDLVTKGLYYIYERNHND